MDKKNIIVFAEPRSGTTAFTQLIYDNNEQFCGHEIHTEYLSCYDSFIPSKSEGDFRPSIKFRQNLDPAMQGNLIDKLMKINHYGAIDNTESQLWQDINLTSLLEMIVNSDCKSIKKFYDTYIDMFRNQFYCDYVIKNNKITRKYLPWKHRIFNKNFSTIEIRKRIKLLNKIGLDPYCFKYFQFNIDSDDWIDRKNTTVIVQYRKDILASLASHTRVQFSKIYNVKPDREQFYINRSMISDNLIKEKQIKRWIENRYNFIRRVQALKPDVIVNYEALTKALNRSGYKKITIEPIQIFYNDFDKATYMVNDIPPLENKNTDLVEKIIGVPVNG